MSGRSRKRAREPDVDDVDSKGSKSYWLMKSEPHCFSLENLKSCTDQVSGWDGVRNYEARNILRDKMKVGDLAFFYHSSCKEPGIVGIVTINRAGYPDPTQFDKKSEYYDATSTKQSPKWFQVDVKFESEFPALIGLAELRKYQQAELSQMALFRKSRLSVSPVTEAEWNHIVQLASTKR
eukprot:TRINITY_DN28314_c0_g1_i1.p1 TRINITY_DN28314_c0_g1~~TRINITY_DN28314_c0_g1_i1.p1  ORF type:complete len:180 (+),score=25.76 TRINITY_DN28314_c0_g1_i1:95-634(+)